MVTVTDKALLALQEILKTKNVDNQTAVRLMVSPEANQSLAMVLDKQKDADEVVKNELGTPVLLTDPTISQALAESIIDYRDSGEQSGFTIVPKNNTDTNKN